MTRAPEQPDAAAEAPAVQPRSPPEGPRRPRVFAPWARGYRREWPRPDVVAGVSSPARFAVLSAALALVTAGVLVGSGLLGLGSVADLISKPVMTGFLFGLGLTIAVGQLPKVLGVDDPGGDFFPRL